MKGISQIISALGVVVFGYFAWLQLDDANPQMYHQASAVDAFLWLAFYLSLAIVCALALAGWTRPWMPLLVAGFCLIQLAITTAGVIDNVSQGGGFTLAGSQMAPDRPRVELSREFFGALAGLAGMGMVWWQVRRGAGARMGGAR